MSATPGIAEEAASLISRYGEKAIREMLCIQALQKLKSDRREDDDPVVVNAMLEICPVLGLQRGTKLSDVELEE